MLLGTEQEYGIHHSESAIKYVTPEVLSDQVVRAYEDIYATHINFDYQAETPLLDAWGNQIARLDAAWDLRTNEHQVANRMLSNGARYYVDHAHPEYSGPEVTSWLDALRYGLAGDRIISQAAAKLRALGQPVTVFKNNTDGKGHSYGSHENYLLPRSFPFSSLVQPLATFLVSRQILNGTGRVGLGVCSQQPGFQISQRADFFEKLTGLETTVCRGIINTRDEPLAQQSKWRRLHVIIGDGCQSQVAFWLTVATTSIVLELIQRGAAPQIELQNPVAALQTISHDPSLQVCVETVGGQKMRAIDIQRAFCEAAQTSLAKEPLLEAEDANVLEAWQETLDLLDKDLWAGADRLEWVAKLRLMEQLRQRNGWDWDGPQLAALDLRWAMLDDQNLVRRLEASAELITLVSEAEIMQAMTEPPQDTRAAIRAALLRQCQGQIVSLGWDGALLQVGEHRRIRLEFADPYATAVPVWKS